jgi:hypothetical protein
VLVIVENFPTRILTNTRIINGRNVVFFVVDRWIFERDTDRGFLGEALASLMLFPYAALLNQRYFRRQEVLLKKRLSVELLQNLVVGYPEFSQRVRIKPEYFMYAVILNRIKVFPPMAYGASDFLSGKAQEEKTSSSPRRLTSLR